MKKENHKILFVVVDGFQSLDLFGPLEVFATAKEVSSADYSWSIAAFSDEPVVSESGSKILPDEVISNNTEVDTLVFCGGCGPRTVVLSEADKGLLQGLYNRSERVVGICTGAFLLSQLGLSEGKRMATHWRYTDDLASSNQSLEVDDNSLYVVDDKVWTSAGVTAGIDLCLALVGKDYGQAVASAVARQLVVYMRRTGGQAQFSEPLKAQAGNSGRITELLNWMINNLGEELTVESLASRAGLGERQFSRVFTKTTGKSPAKYVEHIRLNHARQLLTEGKVRIDEIARLVGYSSSDSFRRAFERKFSVSISLYKKQFSNN